jgi:hypothetical protein
MYKSGFGAYSRTGRSIELGRSFGENQQSRQQRKTPRRGLDNSMVTPSYKKLSKTANQQ